MKVGLVGSVGSSLLTLKKLYEYQFDIVGVWGYEPNSTHNVSGYHSLREFSEEHHLPFYPFVNINNKETIVEIKKAQPEILFVVGLSQLIDKEIIEYPKYGCVGFHPTKLPRGRGRAPLAWLVLNEKEGAATFFKIDSEADKGDIYIQETYSVEEEDDAYSIGQKLNKCILSALDTWLPILKEKGPIGFKQDDSKATYYARRAPLDGFINWYDQGSRLNRVIKAATRPHPGAFSFYEDYKVVIWKCNYHQTGYPTGVIGRVVAFNEGNPVIQTGDGFIEIIEYEIQDIQENRIPKELVVGSRLGYYEQYEIFKLRNELKDIKSKIDDLYEKCISYSPTSR